MYRYLHLLQVWEWAVPQHHKVQALLSLACLHGDSEARQRLEVWGVSLSPEGVLCQVWQWSGPRVSQRRTQTGAVAILNILLLSHFQGQLERERGGIMGGGEGEGEGCRWEWWWFGVISNYYYLLIMFYLTETSHHEAWQWNSVGALSCWSLVELQSCGTRTILLCTCMIVET